MRNQNYFALMSAALLTGAVAFSSCSSDDELAGDNTGTTPTGEVVKTQFAINIPAGGQGTRLAEGIVQGQTAPVFRGMTNIRLVPFALGGSLSGGLTNTTTSSIQPIALGAIGISELEKVNGSYKVYSDVDVPVGVDYFLFYGEASETAGGSLTNGSLIPSYEVSGWPLNQQLSELQFDLEPIIGTGSVTTTQATLAQMLTDIASVTGTTGSNTAWSAATGVLKNYYDNFIDLSAGSANSIKAALQDLFNAMKSDRVTDVDGLKEAICTEIEESFDATPLDGTYTLEWKNAIAEDVKTFPENLGLPDGSQQLTFSAGSFSYAVPSTSVSQGNILQQTGYDKYVYPASLFYKGKTGIKVADQSMAANGSYTGTDWSNILGQSGWNDAAVSSTTQSIILKDPINYAVSSLNLFVRFADDYIYDNGANYTPKGAAQPIGEIAVPIPAEGFSLNGILVGGQKPVNWDFNTVTSAQDADAWTIYDASTEGAKVTKANAFDSDPTAYTLALETAGVTAGAAEGEKVRFALEMTNESGAAFTGADGIVPAGGKFYLVGELVSETQDGGALKVFEQDHKTVARVLINSLKSAYNCIPDLRAPRLELGLSVDLTWEAGLVYDVTIP